MKVFSIEFLVVLIGAASLSSAEKLRGDAAKRGVYKGQVHVVPFTQTGRNLEGEVPVPPVFNTDRQAPAGEEGRSLYAGGPNVVHTANEGPIVGTVFHDVNRNSVQDADETGIAGVMVSDGKNVVMTDSNGAYELPAPSEEEADAGFSVFITKPAGYSVPVNDAMVPQFHYFHKPKGSPMSLHGRPFRYGGMPPSGPIPSQINFPLIETEDVQQFKIIVSGDPQTYSNNEIGMVRDSIVKDVASMEDMQAIMFIGDIMGDDLSLYKRFREIVGLANLPQYYCAGNHDVDFDSPEFSHSFDTFRRELGPDYHSFDIGQVHFIVGNDVYYPCTPDQNEDGFHEHCDTPGRYDYNGIISERQMTWMKNDIANVPEDKIIFLAMHIPIAAFIDQYAAKHMVDNVVELYEALGCTRSEVTEISRQFSSEPANIFLPENCARRVVSVHGHTHTNDNMLPGETFEGFNTALGERSGGPVPFQQIIVGAACGNWWSGELNDATVPESFQRLGAPRGYWIFEFDGNSMVETFRIPGKPEEKQMHMDFATPEFAEWYEILTNWTNSGPEPDDVPPLTINDLPDTRNVILGSATNLTVNVYAGTREHTVEAFFDGGEDATVMTRTQPGNGEGSFLTLDPYALKRQMSVARHAYESTSGNDRTSGFEMFRGSTFQGKPKPLEAWGWADQSMHVWQVPVPTEELGLGVHTVTVVATDQYGRAFRETMPFEISEKRPSPYFQTEFFPVTP